DLNHVYLTAGFEPGKIYEVIYTTTGAPVIGLGLLAARDIVSFLRHSNGAENPCAGDYPARLRLRRVAKRAFSAPAPLSRPKRRRGGTDGIRRRAGSHRRRQARRRLQHAVRAAVGVAAERPVPIQ